MFMRGRHCLKEGQQEKVIESMCMCIEKRRGDTTQRGRKHAAKVAEMAGLR